MVALLSVICGLLGRIKSSKVTAEIELRLDEIVLTIEISLSDSFNTKNAIQTRVAPIIESFIGYQPIWHIGFIYWKR